MFLHNDRELFSEVIYSTAAALEMPVAIVEKDYYVTMILKQLAENVPEWMQTVNRMKSWFTP